MIEYEFIGTCESFPNLTEGTVEISRRTFLKQVNREQLAELERSLGYEDHPSKGMTMAQEPYITYWKRIWRGRHCVGFTWSQIDHIFCAPGSLGMGADDFVLNEWSRCGNTLFFVRTRHHDVDGYTFINPADFVLVKWEYIPEGYKVVRRELPQDAPKDIADQVEASLLGLPTILKDSIYSWLRLYNVMKGDKKSPAAIAADFEKGYDVRQRNLVLDAFEKGLFTAAIPWVKKEALVSKEMLNDTLSDFGVMECPEGQI